MAQFQHVPYDSCVPTSTKVGILHTEFVRLARTNDHFDDWWKQVLLFSQKIHERGYPSHLIRSVLNKRHWDRKHDFLEPRAADVESTPILFKIRFFDQADKCGLGRKLNAALSRHWSDMDRSLPRIIICWRSNPSLFRRRFSRFLSQGEITRVG